MADPEKPLTAEQIAKLEVKSDENIGKKYDRQIRLWGIHGQTRLQNVHVCLLGAGPAGSETLKNLVLPGIGKFSVIDGEKVTHRDLGNNFFVEVSGVGKSRAEEVGRLVQELNGFVDKGQFLEQDPVNVVASNPEFVRDFDVIIANNLSDQTLSKLGEQCEKWNKILVSVTTNGMIGAVKIYAAEHRVLESKPDGDKWDLRIQNPWPELQEFIDSFDLDEMKADLKKFSPEFTHVPFPVVLAKVLASWKKDHNGSLPTTPADKDAFRDAISALGGGLRIADNFQECFKFKYLAYVPYEIPCETQEIFDDEKCQNITGDSKQFWLLAHAVKKFVDNEGQGYLPLAGALPDITAKPDNYMKMQQLFRQKAAQDCAVVKRYLQELLKSINKSPDDVPDEKINLFCKHASVMKVFRYPAAQNEFDNTKINKENIPTWEESGKWYLALRAAGKFYSEHGRLPGDRNDDGQADFEGLKKQAVQLIKDLELEAPEPEEGEEQEELLSDKYLKEICRFGGSQIHNIAALIGGVAAQETIKLVTRQWYPVDNTFVYSGISGTSAYFAI